MNNYNFINDKYVKHMSRKVFWCQVSNNGRISTVYIRFKIFGITPTPNSQNYSCPYINIHVMVDGYYVDTDGNCDHLYELHNRLGSNFRHIYDGEEFVKFLRYHGLNPRDELIFINTYINNYGKVNQIDKFCMDKFAVDNEQVNHQVNYQY